MHQRLVCRLQHGRSGQLLLQRGQLGSEPAAVEGSGRTTQQAAVTLEVLVTAVVTQVLPLLLPFIRPLHFLNTHR